MKEKQTSALLVPAIAASQFASPFMISGVAVALPSLSGELHAGATALSLVETLFLAASVALLLPAGRLGDASDKVTLYKVGLLAFGLVSIAVGLVSSVPAVLALRFVQGIASAMTQASAAAIVADNVPPARRGRAYGIIIGSVYAGLTLGPIVAGFLVDLWSWRAVFVAGGIVVLVLLLPMHSMLDAHWRRPQPRAVHVPSAILVVVALLALVGGAATLREGTAGYVGVAIGLALLALFVFYQRGIEQPLLNVGMLVRNHVLGSALLVQWLLYCNAFGTVFLLSLYLQSVLGDSANTAGIVIAVSSVLMAALAPVAGALSDRLRPTAIATFGVSVAFASMVWAALLGRHSSLVEVGLVLAVQGVGFAFFSSPNMITVMNSIPPERTGIAAALSATARSLGMVTGMLIVAALVSVFLGNSPVGAHPDRYMMTMHAAFWVLAGITGLGVALSLLRVQPKRAG